MYTHFLPISHVHITLFESLLSSKVIYSNTVVIVFCLFVYFIFFSLDVAQIERLLLEAITELSFSDSPFQHPSPHTNCF